MVFTYSNVKGLYFTTSDTSSSTIEKKIKKLAETYISNGLSPIVNAIHQYQRSFDKHLFGVFCVSETGQEEEWISLNVSKKEDVPHRSTFSIKDAISLVVDTFKQGDASTFEVVEKTLTLFFNDELYDVTVSQYSGTFTNVFNTALETICNVPKLFDREVVARVCDVRVKDQLKRFLPSLESMMTIPKYILDRQKFTNLCEKINSENFAPSNEEAIDLRVKILALIVQLKDNGQIIDPKVVKDVFENKKGFLVKQETIFLKEIKEYDEQLKEDPRRTMVKTCLHFAINDRIEYLCNKNKLVPNLVTPDEIFEMFQHFVLTEEIDNLKKDENRLEKECNEKFKEVTQEDDPLIQASIDENMKLNETHHELEYLRVKFSIRNDCNFKKLIPALASKALDDLKVPVNFLNKIFEIEFSELLVTDIIKIIFSLSKTDKIQSFPDNFYQYLTPEQLIELTEYLSVFSSAFINHLVMIIIDNEQELLRERAFNALTNLSQDLSDETKAIIDLETKIQSDSYKNSDILTHVTKNYRLTWNAFQTLTSISDEVLIVVKTIIDNDLQMLPKFFINTIKTEIKSNLVQSKLWLIQKLKDHFLNADVINLTLKMCELMIVGNYMRMSEVSDCLMNYLKDEKHREIVLNIILMASQSGEIISKTIVKELEIIEPKSALVHNCIRAVTKEETLFDVLKNSKKSIEDRKSAMQHLIQDKTCHIDYLVQILVDSVIYEEKLRDDAFEAFLTVITPDTWKTCCNRFSKMIDALKVPASKIPIRTISDASKKSFLRTNDALIDYLLYRLSGDDFRVKTDCVAILIDMLKMSENEAWAKVLLDIVCSERDSELKLSILNLITEGFNFELLDQSTKIKVDTLKILLCDKIDETCLSTLFKMINEGLVVPEAIIHGINRCLPNEEYTRIASQCLLMIHSQQGLMPQSLQSVFLTIEEHPKILSNHYLLMLLHNGMHPNQKLSTRILERLLELLSDDSINLLVLNILTDYLKHNIELPQVKQRFIEILQEHCLELSDIKFVKAALQTWILIDDSISTNDGFIHDYYEKLQPFLSFSNDVSQENLEMFVSNTSNDNRIRLLHALTVIAMNDYHLNPEMFVQKPESEWLKDLLVDILIQSVIVKTGELNELALFDFLTELKVLEVRLSQDNQRLESVLECLVDSNLNNFDSFFEILFLIKDTDALHIFISDSKDIADKMYKMKKNLIKKRHPSFSSNQLEKLLKHISHLPVRMIEKLIDVECDSSESLIKFFERVQLNLTQEHQEYFLDKISRIRNFQSWNAALSREIVKRLIHERQIVLNDELSSFELKLSRVLDSGWSIRSIEMILEHGICSKDVQSILSALDVIYEYKMKEYDTDISGRSLIEIISTTPVSSWSKVFNKIAIFQTFPGTYQKPVEQLFEEINKLNSGHNIGYLKDCKRIQQDYKHVMEAYRKKSLILTESRSTISKYDKNLIKNWSKRCKDHQPSLYESVAVAMRAVEILNNFLPRDIQILSLLCLLNPDSDKGRLAQINTGEGKTTIIAMLAVIKALQGHTIDIITSSGELAKPQSIEMSLFYSLFDLTVAHNGEDSKDIKERYKANILYGAADAFQGDILRDEYSKLGTRNGRKCDLAIVDEVDSMLIDGKNHIVMLSSFMPAMNYLETVLAAIYMHIGTAANLIKEENGKTFIVKKNNKINGDGSIMKDVEDELIELTVTKKEFIEQSTELHIRRMLRDTDGLKDFTEEEQKIPDDYTELSIPQHLYKLVTQVQLKKWIESAIYAMFKCDINKDYVLTEDGKVAPVDATNTGVIQQNMHWNNGLHQFLQIKHGGKITPENLTTNFISNVSFFKRYGSNLFGLTGTLGSDDSIKLLNKTYSVDSLIIPPFKQKQHHELSPIIVMNEQEWYANIIDSTLQKLRQGRGVLIIARYINQVNYIHETLKSQYDPKKIKVYKTQRESDSVHAELKGGEVIIATNIAGRGTDIKPSPKMDENGGLHVCLTFLPGNNRVEAQNVGRTSRTGNKGTSQFILLEKSNQSLTQLRLIRNVEETESLKKAETEIARVCTKDAVFHEFCNFLNKFDKDEIRPVEERFGIWLQMNAAKFEIASEDTLLKLFKDTFAVEVMNDKYSNQLIQNICFHILKANKFIRSKKYDEAIVECNKAIETNPDFADTAYYCRGYCRIAKYGGDSWWTSQNKEMIRLARADFEKAREIINKRLLELNIIQKASDGPNLSDQVKHKITIYQVQLGTIQQAIGLDMDEANEELSNLNKNEEKVKELIKTEETENLKNHLNDIQSRIQQIKEDIGKDEGGVIGKALRNNRDIRIVMMELETNLPSDQGLQYYKQEIDEFKGNGMIGHFNISELKPIPWKDVFTMACIAFVQIAVGAYIMTSSLGAGSQIGKTLILEGISDLITAVKDGIINRNIDWKMWGMMKGISLTASLCLCSTSAIKDASKSVQAVGQGVKTIGQGATKEGLKIALKNVGFELAKGVAREVVTSLAEYGLEQTLLKQIEEYLVTKLQPNIQAALERNTQIQQLLEIDLKNRNSHFQNLIRQEAHNILFPKNGKNNLDVQDLAKMFATRIANAKVKNLAMATQVLSAVKASYELAKFEESFIKKFNESINKIMKTVEKTKNASENSKSTTRDARQQEVTQRNLESPEMDDDDLNLDKAKDKPEYATVQEGYVSSQNVCKAVSEDVAKKMTNIIKSKIVMPVASATVNFTMEKVTSGFEKKLAKELDTYKSNRVIHAKQDRLPDEIKNRAKDPEFMKEAKKKTEALVKTLEEGGEIGLIEADFVSEAINQKINIYDKDGKLYKVINDHLPGNPVEVQHHPGQDGNPGHWTLPNGVEPTISSGKNNCFLDCIAQQTGKNSNDLRTGTVQHMNQNTERLAMVMPEVETVKMYRSNYLQYGGARKHFPKPNIIEKVNEGRRKHKESLDDIDVESASVECDSETGAPKSQRVHAKHGPESRRVKGTISTSKETNEDLRKKGHTKGMDKGHLHPRSSGGTSAPENITPMPKEFNRAGGAYRSMETEIKKDKNQNKAYYDSNYHVNYEPTSTKGVSEPKEIIAEHKISHERDGPVVKERIDQMNPLTNTRKTTHYNVTPDGQRVNPRIKEFKGKTPNIPQNEE